MRVRDEQKKEAIHMAALELITTEGLAGSSMSKIAKSAGVSPATIYIYFENKEDMLNKLYLLVKERSAEFIFRDFNNVTNTRNGFYKFIERQINFMFNNPIYFSFHEQFLNSPKINKDVKLQAMEFFAPIIRLFKEGVESGEILPYQTGLIEAFVIAPVFSATGAAIKGELLLDNDNIKILTDMCWKAITP